MWSKNNSCMVMVALLLLLLPYGSHGKEDPKFKLKAVNLGGWLVTEGWILPSLFDRIPNNDLLDGTKIHLQSVTTGKFLSAESGGGSIIVANRVIASGWETFTVLRKEENTFNFRVNSYQFVGVGTAGGIGSRAVGVAGRPGNTEGFTIVRNQNRIKIRASNGMFLQAKKEDVVTADHSGDGGWGHGNPSVFEINIAGKPPQGEYQLTNGLGPQLAPKVMREHWNNYIREEDFVFMARNGINGVRIPVGWWIASGANPPSPFVGGSLDALDNAFSWATKHNMKVIIDLHAAPGSQNGNEHSASIDWSQNWGTSKIQQTVDVIGFLAARYADHPSLYAVELMNEPLAPGVTLDTLKKYYQMGYDAVRRHTQSAYVVLSNRIGPGVNPRELFPLARGMQKVVIDVHYYNMFEDKFKSMNPNQNIEFVYNARDSEISELTTRDGPLIFVGEWMAEWDTKGASKEEYKRFANAQLEVFGKATFGWAYWTFKNVKNHASLQWMITNGFITVPK